MAAMATVRAWLAVKPHRPLIKFRKGVITGNDLRASQAAPRSGAESVGSSRTPAEPKPILEDWQMPKKYQRLPISEEEIDFINTGGPPLKK